MASQQLNSEFFHNLSIIASDEALMKKAVRSIRRIVAKKQDQTLMSNEELNRICKEGETEYCQGKTTTLLPGESLEDMLRRSGYEL